MLNTFTNCVKIVFDKLINYVKEHVLQNQFTKLKKKQSCKFYS